MALKPNKKGVLTGTKKNDKITWLNSRDWSKIITVNAGDGSDVINFKKSKYKNKLNGQNGNDTIYGGTNTDTINGGNGNDKIYGYNGNDIIYAGYGNDYVYGGNGNDKLYGQYGTNHIYGNAGNDTICGGSGNDYIWGGTGNDTINAGKGTNNIFYSLGDGNDIINYGGAGSHDTLCFDSGTTIAASWSGNDLKIKYSGKKSGKSYSNTITVKNFKNKRGIEYIKVGSSKKAISKYLPPNEIHIKSTDNGRTFNLSAGNNKVVFDNAPNLGTQNTIVSANRAGNGCTDTIKFSGLSLTDGALTFSTVNNANLMLSAADYEDAPGQGSVIFKNFYSTTAGNIKFTDSDRTYIAKGYGSFEDDIPNDGANRVIVLRGDSYSEIFDSSSAYNVIYSFGSLFYRYKGGHDTVVSASATADNDWFDVGLSETTSLSVVNMGGQDDVLLIDGENLATDLRLLFNVYYDEGSGEWICNSDHVIFALENNVSEDILTASTLQHTTLVNGINLFGQIDDIRINEYDEGFNQSQVNIDSWCNQIKGDVVGWLTDAAHQYNSVADALANCNNQDAISELVNCYNTAYIPNV